MKKPFQTLFYGLSFGESYVFATLFYLGMSLVLISSVPENKPAFADSEECSYTITVTDEAGTHDETFSGCPDGQICCNGTCIASGQGCCNGTAYDTSTHGCCNGVVYDNETEGCCQGTTIYNLETCCCTEAGASCNNSSEDM